MIGLFERLSNPVKCCEDQGTKCIWCAFYEEICLPRAAYRNWKNFHCGACVLKRDTPWPVMMEYMQEYREKKNVSAQGS